MSNIALFVDIRVNLRKPSSILKYLKYSSQQMVPVEMIFYLLSSPFVSMPVWATLMESKTLAVVGWFMERKLGALWCWRKKGNIFIGV